VFNREVLWNAVEQVERRKDAQLAREMEIALPVELGKDEQIALVREFAQRAFRVNRRLPRNFHTRFHMGALEEGLPLLTD
jgi:hypothetical protein